MSFGAVGINTKNPLKASLLPKVSGCFRQPLFYALLLLGLVQVLSPSALALDPEITLSEDQTTLIVNDAPEQDVIAIGKSVTVNKRAKSILALGGDIVVEGRVEGDVATVGGNIIQKKDAYVGGNVIVFGGAYKPERETPLREPGRETVVVGMFEDELRTFAQNPSEIFAPRMSLSFVAQRLLVALFWFVLSLVITTLAPGAVGRAVARINLSFLKVTALGAAAFLTAMAIIIGGVLVLPDYLSVMLGLMGTVLLLLGYMFGRVALQVSAGKLFQKHLLAEHNRSETLALLIGVLVWTVLLSLPYVWPIALFAVFTVGIGLVLTGRSNPAWKTP